MITLQKSGDSAVKFVFENSQHYLYGNGEIVVPLNSLLLVEDSSDMVTFKKIDGDIFVSALYSDFGMSKAELETFYKNNMVGSTGGGGGGGITSGEVQTMIDESISGKADTSAVTEEISEATSGKVDTSTYNTYTAATNTAISRKQGRLNAGDGISIAEDDNTIKTQYRGWGDFQQYDFHPIGSFYVVVGFDCGGTTEGSARFEFEVDNETKEVTINFDSSTESWTCDNFDDPQICEDLWQYLEIDWDGYKGAFYVRPYVEVTVNDNFCTRFAYDLEYAGTTTDALDAVFGNLEQKADSVSVVSSAEYVSSSTTIDFKNIDGDVISSINASDFIVDVMVEDVRIDTISGVSYLVIDFNTASGKQDIQIPLTDIFDPSNYYNKTEIDAALSGKADTTAVTEAISEATSGKVDTTTYTAYTASTDSRIAEDEEVTAAALNDLNEAVSGKADTSAVTEAISEATSGKVDTTTYTAYTASTDARIAEDEEVTAAALNALNEGLSGKADTSSVIATSAITSAVTSASTDSEIPTAKAVFDAIGQGGGSITIDPTLDSGSTNAVANSAITTALNDKASKSQAYGSYAFGTTNNMPFIRYKSISNNNLGNELYFAKINNKDILTSNSTWARNNLDLSLLETSAVTSSMTSSSTDAQVPSAKCVYDQLGGLKLQQITQANYDALVSGGTVDSSTLYIIV